MSLIKKLRRKSLFAGFLVHSALVSLIQDYFGPIEYVRRIESNWIDAGITVPFAIAVLVIAWVLHNDTLDQSKKRNLR